MSTSDSGNGKWYLLGGIAIGLGFGFYYYNYGKITSTEKSNEPTITINVTNNVQNITPKSDSDTPKQYSETNSLFTIPPTKPLTKAQRAKISMIQMKLELYGELKKVKISKTAVTNKDVHDLVEVLRRNHKLKQLDIEDTVLSIEHIEQICSLFDNNTSSITDLNLSNTNLSSKHINIIANSIKNNSSLKVLNLSHNDLSGNNNNNNNNIETGNEINENDKSVDSLISNLSTLINLNVLNLNSTKINTNLLGKLNIVLENTTNLREMTMAFNDIDDNTIELIKHGLFKNKSLIEIDLSFNKIGDKGVEILCEAMKEHNKIQSINLSANKITGKDKSMKLMSELIINVKSINTIELSSNNLEFSSLNFIINSLSESTLKVLKLDNCSLIDLHFNQIGQKINNKNINLHTIDISNNKMENKETSIYFIDQLLMNEKLIEVYMINMSITTDIILYLANKLRNRKSNNKMIIDIRDNQLSENDQNNEDIKFCVHNNVLYVNN